MLEKQAEKGAVGAGCGIQYDDKGPVYSHFVLYLLARRPSNQE